MNVLVSLLIVAMNPDAPIEARCPGAVEVFHCPYDESWDTNYDGQPDRWVRRKGPGFPHYVEVGIREEPSPAGNRSLGIDLDGGAAALFSPPIPIGPLYAYVLEGVLATEGLQHDRAYLSLTLLDKGRHRLETFHSEAIRDSQGWKKVRLDPVTPGDEARFAVIGLHLEPGVQMDLTGLARFDEVWLGRLPRISLSAGDGPHVFTDPNQVTVTCNASGLPVEDPAVVFHLEDVSGEKLAEGRERMKTRVAPGDHPLSRNGPPDEPPLLVGTAEWKPPIPGPGFYRVRANVDGGDDLGYRCEGTLAVIRPRSTPPGGEFGWSLPQGDKPLPLDDLIPLVGQSGIGWVKYPLWLDAETSDEKVQELSRFSQGLTAQGIQLVGLLDDPPEALRSQFGDVRSPAEIFAGDPGLWYPRLASGFARLGIPVRWWQLGRDTDTGFVGYPKLAEKVAQVKSQLDQLSHDVNLGFGWNWKAPLPESPGQSPAWRFLSLSADPPPTQEELSAYLAATKQPQLRRWVVLEPMARQVGPLEARAADLVERMISAKIDGAEGIFISDPFQADRGLMNADGTPGELLLVWRTTALMLAGAEYLGSIQLPGESRNHIFARGSEAVMVVSSVFTKTPTREVICLGHDVRQVDLWGRESVPQEYEHRQIVEVGSLPSFVTGIDEKTVRWRQSFALASGRVVETASHSHQNGFQVKNPFGEEVSGRLTLVIPDAREVNPERIDFRLAGGETLEQPFEITLPYNATSGRHPVRVDFELETGQTRRFSAYRHLDVGPDDVNVEIITRLNERGELEVEQRFVNNTDSPVSFRCQLSARGRRRQKTQVLDLGRGRDVHVFRIPDGEQLIGTTLWLRAEQIDGPRVLNYRFTAKAS
ncbi:MAG: hypothetical protein ABIP48_12525 [Planctomycetota bacterium]